MQSTAEFNGAAIASRFTCTSIDCLGDCIGSAVVTVMDVVVAPVLHNKGPVKPEAVNTELPQLLTTPTLAQAVLLLVRQCCCLQH